MKFNRTCPVIIFEGGEAVGKSTLAEGIAEAMDAELVHHGPYLNVSPEDLPRLYVEAMAPALLGLRPVVLDRSWLSETVYGPLCRGRSRLGASALRTLDRAAWRAEASVIRVSRPFAEAEADAEAGRHYAGTPDRRRLVWEAYRRPLPTSLPVLSFEWSATHRDPATLVGLASNRHPSFVRSAGNIQAPVIVTLPPQPHATNDSVFQFAGVSFGSKLLDWWAETLTDCGIRESDLCWATADRSLLDLSAHVREDAIWVGLGQSATDRTRAILGVDVIPAPDPPAINPNVFLRMVEAILTQEVR